MVSNINEEAGWRAVVNRKALSLMEVNTSRDKLNNNRPVPDQLDDLLCITYHMHQIFCHHSIYSLGLLMVSTCDFYCWPISSWRGIPPQ